MGYMFLKVAKTSWSRKNGLTIVVNITMSNIKRVSSVTAAEETE